MHATSGRVLFTSFIKGGGGGRLADAFCRDRVAVITRDGVQQSKGWVRTHPNNGRGPRGYHLSPFTMVRSCGFSDLSSVTFHARHILTLLLQLCIYFFFLHFALRILKVI